MQHFLVFFFVVVKQTIITTVSSDIGIPLVDFPLCTAPFCWDTVENFDSYKTEQKLYVCLYDKTGKKNRY